MRIIDNCLATTRKESRDFLRYLWTLQFHTLLRHASPSIHRKKNRRRPQPEKDR